MSTKPPRSVVYIITCETCGHNWQGKAAAEGQVVDCIFCGRPGQLRVGSMPELPFEWGGTLRVEAWIRRAESPKPPNFQVPCDLAGP